MKQMSFGEEEKTSFDNSMGSNNNSASFEKLKSSPYSSDSKLFSGKKISTYEYLMVQSKSNRSQSLKRKLLFAG